MFRAQERVLVGQWALYSDQFVRPRKFHTSFFPTISNLCGHNCTQSAHRTFSWRWFPCHTALAESLLAGEHCDAWQWCRAHGSRPPEGHSPGVTSKWA